MDESDRSAKLSESPEKTLRSLCERFGDLLWVPSLFIAAVLVAVYAVDIPTIDQWDGELPFLRKVFAGQAGVKDLVEPLCEHRLMMTRLLGLGVASIAGWNPRVALCNTLLCGAALAFSLSLLNRRTCRPTAWRIVIPNLVGGALVLGVPQYDTWLNPMHVSWYIVELLLVLSLLVACSSLVLASKVALCIALAMTATFSCANGLLLWFLVLPVVLVHERNPWQESRRNVVVKVVGVWAVAAILAAAGYFWGWQKPDETPPLAANGNIALFLRFFVANVGCPFAYGTAVEPVLMATLCGTAVLVLSLLCVVCVVVYRDNLQFVRNASPWLAIIGFGLATGLAIAIGRSGFGIDTAIVVRSIHGHALTVYALLVLVPMVLDVLTVDSGERRGESSVVGRSATQSPALSPQAALVLNAVLCTLVFTLHVLYCVFSLERYESERSRYLAAKTAVLFSRSFMDGQLLGNVWSFKTVRDIGGALDFMDTEGFLRPKTFKTALVKDFVGFSRTPGSTCGGFEQAAKASQDSVFLGGWAILPGKARPADSVLISWEADGVDPTVFAIAPVGGVRADVAEKLGSTRFRRSGWGRGLPKDIMPKQSAKLRAWAFDVREGRAYPIDGAVDWSPD